MKATARHAANDFDAPLVGSAFVASAAIAVLLALAVGWRRLLIRLDAALSFRAALTIGTDRAQTGIVFAGAAGGVAHATFAADWRGGALAAVLDALAIAAALTCSTGFSCAEIPLALSFDAPLALGALDPLAAIEALAIAAALAVGTAHGLARIDGALALDAAHPGGAIFLVTIDARAAGAAGLAIGAFDPCA